MPVKPWPKPLWEILSDDFAARGDWTVAGILYSIREESPMVKNWFKHRSGMLEEWDEHYKRLGI
jgi:hypothetical protein